MSIFTKIFSKGAKELTDSVGGIIDNLTTTDQEKSTAKSKITSIVLGSLGKLIDAQRDVIVTEMQGNWLQKSWRPITMLTFVALLVMRWMGLSTADIPLELEVELMAIIKLGLGGFVIARSVEKITDRVTKNIDLSFLRKKDRKDAMEK